MERIHSANHIKVAFSRIGMDWRCLDPVGPRPAHVEFFEFEVKPELLN